MKQHSRMRTKTASTIKSTLKMSVWCASLKFRGGGRKAARPRLMNLLQQDQINLLVQGHNRSAHLLRITASDRMSSGTRCYEVLAA
jgi:hypothetical protein